MQKFLTILRLQQPHTCILSRILWIGNTELQPTTLRGKIRRTKKRFADRQENHRIWSQLKIMPTKKTVYRQCFGSGFNQISGSGSRMAKMTHKTRKEISCFEVLKVLFESWRLLLQLRRPLWRPREKQIKIWIFKKFRIFFISSPKSSIRIEIGNQPKMLDQVLINSESKHLKMRPGGRNHITYP